jgi:hypothetical protein
MKDLIIAEGIDATGTVTQTAVHPTATPFLQGRDVVCKVQANGLTGTPTIIVEGSDDNFATAATTLITHTALYTKEYNIKCWPYMRARQSVAGSAGTYNVYCTNGA